MHRGLINHLDLTVSDLAVSCAFYDKVLGEIGYTRSSQYAGEVPCWEHASADSTFSIGLHVATSDAPHDRHSAGLHHLAFHLPSRAEIDEVYAFLLRENVCILDKPAEYDYTPGYYALFFADPDGIKLELVHEPRLEQSQAIQSGHAPVNGINMYYEVHGRADGVPLVLLHGGGSTIDLTFSRVLPVFAANRRVIAVEEQGHGRTTDRDAPVTFESSADDVAGLLRYLEIAKADIFGFSNGASVGLQVAIRHPHLVRRLVFASSMTRRDGAHPELWEFMRNADFSSMPQPLKDAFLQVNPDVRQLEMIHDKDAERMRSFADLPDGLLRSVGAPTLIVLGDRDIVKLDHAVDLSRLIPGARLLVLPGGHGDYLGEAVMTQGESRYPALTAALIEAFLDSR